jgi:hypothetical protein
VPTVYHNLYEISELQQKIMRYVDYWVHTEKTPVPQSKIAEEMEDRNEKATAVPYALKGLVRLGYLRKAVVNSRVKANSPKTLYVQLRRL